MCYRALSAIDPARPEPGLEEIQGIGLRVGRRRWESLEVRVVARIPFRHHRGRWPDRPRRVDSGRRRVQRLDGNAPIAPDFVAQCGPDDLNVAVLTDHSG